LNAPVPEFEGKRLRLDAWGTLSGAFLFSAGLAVPGVVVPLLAVDSGYSAPHVGVLVALSAVSQLVTRLFMGGLLRRFPDKLFITAAAVALAVSCVVITWSTAWEFFVLSQLFQGVARAFFWTGTQTHAVRTAFPAARALASVNVAASFGAIGGPVLAGVLMRESVTVALLVGAATALIALVPTQLLVRLEPFAPRDRSSSRPRIWRRPRVGAACWAGAVSGAWRALLSSYVPVVLDQARHSTATIGILVGVANAAAIVGGAAAGRARARGLWSFLAFGVLAAGIGVGMTGLAATSLSLATFFLLLSGLGAGALQTVGPAVATESVCPDEQGDAIAAVGTFRASALFLAPAGVAALTSFMPIAAGLAITGALMAIPVATVRRVTPPDL
jgi:MFS family permease